MNFAKWLDTLVEEKGLDPYGTTFELEANGVDHFIPLAVVIDFLKNSGTDNQAKVKRTLVMIDFKNGDINHFFRHVAQFLAEDYDGILVN